MSDSFSLFSLEGGANGVALTQHRQIWANEHNFLCSSANSARRTFIMSNFLKSRKLVSMFLIFAIISSNFGLNSRKIWLYLPKNGENFACLEQKNAHYADWIKYQIFCNFGSIFFSARFLRILLLTLYCSQSQF